jgi:hypothetical protein
MERHRGETPFFPQPPTGLADGFGREVRPTATRGFTPLLWWVPGSCRRLGGTAWRALHWAPTPTRRERNVMTRRCPPASRSRFPVPFAAKVTRVCYESMNKPFPRIPSASACSIESNEGSRVSHNTVRHSRHSANQNAVRQSGKPRPSLGPRPPVRGWRTRLTDRHHSHHVAGVRSVHDPAATNVHRHVMQVAVVENEVASA